jgi:hypothetical protein
MAAACDYVGELITPSIGAHYLMKVLDYYFKDSGLLCKAVWLT